MPKDKKTPKKPKPWYLGWGLAKFAGEALSKHQEEMKKKLEQANK